MAYKPMNPYDPLGTEVERMQYYEWERRYAPKKTSFKQPNAGGTEQASGPLNSTTSSDELRKKSEQEAAQRRAEEDARQAQRAVSEQRKQFRRELREHLLQEVVSEIEEIEDPQEKKEAYKLVSRALWFGAVIYAAFLGGVIGFVNYEKEILSKFSAVFQGGLVVTGLSGAGYWYAKAKKKTKQLVNSMLGGGALGFVCKGPLVGSDFEVAAANLMLMAGVGIPAYHYNKTEDPHKKKLCVAFGASTVVGAVLTGMVYSHQFSSPDHNAASAKISEQPPIIELDQGQGGKGPEDTYRSAIENYLAMRESQISQHPVIEQITPK